MTFSIVAADLEAGEIGVAIASCVLAVGAGSCWIRPGAGAVATQSFTRRSYGPLLLDGLGSGASAPVALDALLVADSDRRLRQVGAVSVGGEVAAWTGEDCIAHALHVEGDGFCVQGNVLASPAVVAAMADTFAASRGQPLAERLVAALVAGDGAGGDLRGRQSAALLVCGAEVLAGPGGGAIDLRVDEHPAPIEELARLLDVRRRMEAARDAGRSGGVGAALAWARLADVTASPAERALYRVLSLACAGDVNAARRLAERELSGSAAAGYVVAMAREGALPLGDVLASIRVPGGAGTS